MCGYTKLKSVQSVINSLNTYKVRIFNTLHGPHIHITMYK